MLVGNQEVELSQVERTLQMSILISTLNFFILLKKRRGRARAVRRGMELF